MDECEDDELIAILDDEEEASPPAPPPPRRSRVWAVAGGIAGGVLLSVLGMLTLRHGPQPAAPAPLPVVLTPIAVAEEKLEAPQPPPPPLPAAVETPPVVQPPPPLPQPPVAPAAPSPPAIPEPLERELRAAARAISDAEPLLQEAMSQIDRGNPRRVADTLGTVEDLLQMARDVYERLRHQVPNASTLEFRMAIVDVYLEAVKDGQTRLKARSKQRR